MKIPAIRTLPAGERGRDRKFYLFIYLFSWGTFRKHMEGILLGSPK